MAVIISVVLGAFTYFLLASDAAVLHPVGIIGAKEKELLHTATFLMFVVVIPVFVMAFAIGWRYRANNAKAKYAPEWEQHAIAEAIWWALPFLIIVILSVVTWRATKDLDPFKPIASKEEPMTIQVVALQWKWLFLYPKQKIATVNFVAFPQNRPITFEITADAPMNSFWVPELGGQIFAMPGMKTELNLIAEEPGEFFGTSANISGEGFSGMTFVAKATTQDTFDRWVKEAQRNPSLSYDELMAPSSYVPKAFYTLDNSDLFNKILMKYMYMPSG